MPTILPTISRRIRSSISQSPGSLDYLRTIAKVLAERRVNGETTRHERYFITSLAGSARQLLQTRRTDWQLENGLHWVLDIAFNEDHKRVRKDHGPANFAVLRHIALNLLKQDASVKAGIKAKRLKAGWDEPYLLKVLLGQGHQDAIALSLLWPRQSCLNARRKSTPASRTWPMSKWRWPW